MQFKKVKILRSQLIELKKILDAKYEKANLKEITTKLKYSDWDEQFLIYRLLKKYEYMFDSTLGHYTGTEYEIENHFLFQKCMKKL